jgi:transcriptional regulator with XRE-family HTH domain
MKLLTVERAGRGWSRAELARRAGMSNSTISLIENGRFLPYPGQLQKLAAALGLPPDRANGLLAEVTQDGD